MSVSKIADKHSEFETLVRDAFVKSYQSFEQDKTPTYRNPWKDGVGVTPFGQYNMATGRHYSAANQAMLTFVAIAKGFDGDRWASFNQGQSVGGKIRKGEKGTLIRTSFETKEEVENAKGETEEVKSRRYRYMYVFHESQFDGIKREPAIDWTRTAEVMHKEAEEVLVRSGVPIFHDTRKRAYYNVTKDEIHLPPREDFRSLNDFYATGLHEVGHSTGHPSRLNRDMRSSHDDIALYAKEELRAELFSCLCAARIGLQTDLGQHKAYVKNWIQIVTDKPSELTKAFTDAEKMCTFLGIKAPQHEPLPQVAPDPAKTARVEEGKARFARIEKKSQTLQDPQEWTPAPTQSTKAYEVSQSM